ncbi:MAG: 4Fe-4S binding protein, partial [Elusimicrobia bacterium]|nr:4Fe-4S binding protein [Elusimicrobiota bacterium]
MGLKYLRGVSTLKLDEAKCTGCGMCVQVCPHAVLAMNGRKVRITDID